MDGGLVVVTAQPVLIAEHLVPAVFKAAAATLGQGAVYDVAAGPRGSAVVHIADGGILPRDVDERLEGAIRCQLNQIGLGHTHVIVKVVLGDEEGPRAVLRHLALDWLSKAGPDAFISTQSNAYQQAIRELLDSDRMRIVFQPIVEAWTGRVAGYEALCRGPRGDIFEMPDAFFDAVERSSLQREAYARLLLLAVQRATAVLPDKDALLFLNAPPEDYWVVEGEAQDDGSLWPWSRIVVEVTEKSPLRRSDRFVEVVEWGRRMGVSFALDDVGAGYAGLSSFALLQPEFTKIDMNIVRGCDHDATRRAIIASLVALAHRTGSQVIAEGVETAAELESLRWLGVDLVQGYLVGRPSEKPEVARELWLPMRRRRRSPKADPR